MILNSVEEARDLVALKLAQGPLTLSEDSRAHLIIAMLSYSQLESKSDLLKQIHPTGDLGNIKIQDYEAKVVRAVQFFAESISADDSEQTMAIDLYFGLVRILNEMVYLD